MNLELLERQRLEPPEPDKEITEQDVQGELADMAITKPWLDSMEAFCLDDNEGLCKMAQIGLADAITDNSPTNNMLLGTWFKKIYMLHFEKVAINNIQERRARS